MKELVATREALGKVENEAEQQTINNLITRLTVGHEALKDGKPLLED